MLAVTHHIIVMMAARLNNISSLQEYCILGDDIVIWNDKVAKSYLSLMVTLGVSISDTKSLISSDILEFAKRLKTSSVKDLSPIGAGLVLSALRDRSLVGLLVSTALGLGYLTLPEAFDILKILCPKRQNFKIGLWSCFGLNGLLTSGQFSAVYTGVGWYSLILGTKPFPLRFATIYALNVLIVSKALSVYETALSEFWLSYYKLVTYKDPGCFYIGFIRPIALILSPSLWVYVKMNVVQILETAPFADPDYCHRKAKWGGDSIPELSDRLSRLFPNEIDFTDRKSIKRYGRFINDFDNLVNEALLDYHFPSETSP